MRNSRLLREISLLILGTTVLLSVFTLVKISRRESIPSNLAQYSHARQIAERSFKQRNWDSALASNHQLIEQDPFNSHARYNKAKASYHIVMEAQKMLETIKQSGTRDEVVAARKDFRQKIEMTQQLFSHCMEFSRYRNLSLIFLAALARKNQQHELALDYLESAVDDGFHDPQIHIKDFGSFGDSPRYHQILQREHLNKIENQFTVPANRKF